MLPVRLLCLICLCIFVSNASAQFEIPTDPYTGKPITLIPLANVNTRSLAHQILVSYDAGGVRIDEPISKVGQNWQLLAGGRVARELRGLPDDMLTANSRTGWISNAASVGSFTYP